MTRLSAKLREPAVMLEVYRIRAENGDQEPPQMTEPTNLFGRNEWAIGGLRGPPLPQRGLGYQKKGGNGGALASRREKILPRERHPPRIAVLSGCRPLTRPAPSVVSLDP